MRTNLALCVAVVLSAHGQAFAGECAQPTPECHLDNGKRLLGTDPRRAAGELLASYRLDERTETLALYAGALATWQRILLFRESEIEAANEKLRRRKTRAAGKKDLAAPAESEITILPGPNQMTFDVKGDGDTGPSEDKFGMTRQPVTRR